jgi:hypothetical protein
LATLGRPDGPVVREAVDENQGGVRKIPRIYGERIRRLELTWAPNNEDIARCMLALYNLGAGVTSRLCDEIRAKSYPVDRKSPHIIQMDPCVCSHQPSFPSSWKHSALAERDPLLPWVPRNLWNRGCSPKLVLY